MPPARTAYGAALNKLLDTGVLPDGTGDSGGYTGSIEDRERMAQNRFSVCDVDGDGREELILLYTTTITAGERGFVYCLGGGRQVGSFASWRPIPFSPSIRAVRWRAGWSHNQGKGGSFWPYDLYRYDSFLDVYVDVGSVDAWDESPWP